MKKYVHVDTYYIKWDYISIEQHIISSSSFEGKHFPNLFILFKAGAWPINNAYKSFKKISVLVMKRRNVRIQGYIYSILGRVLEELLDKMREIKSVKIFRQPGKYVAQITKILFRVSNEKTRVSSLLFTVAEAEFLVHITDVILSASI